MFCRPLWTVIVHPSARCLHPPKLGTGGGGVCAGRHTPAVIADTAEWRNSGNVHRVSTYRRRMTIPRTATRTSPTAEADVVEILRSATIFAELPDEALARLAAGCAGRTYRRNQYLWYQGDEGARLVIVASGLVKVVLSSAQGGEVVLTTLGP